MPSFGPDQSPDWPSGDTSRAAPVPTSDERRWAMFMHVGSLFVGVFAPLIMLRKDDGPFLAGHVHNLMNWNISLLVYAFASLILSAVGIGILMMFALLALHPIFSISGAMAANKGQPYKYPLAISFF